MIQILKPLTNYALLMMKTMEILAAIAQTNALLRELISAGTTIEMDGQVVAQTLRTTDSFRRR